MYKYTVTDVVGVVIVFCLLLIHTGEAEKVILAKSGDVISPRVDIQRKKYMKNEDQTWMMSAPSGHWALIFHFMSIESSTKCQHDYIEIRELAGSTGVQRPPTRYCGERLPRPYISEASRLTVRFVSDSIWESEGFNLTVWYGEEKEFLEYKIRQSTRNQPVAISLQADTADDTEESFSRGTLFYILIGSSCAALVLFVVLLTYFGFAMRRQVLTHETRVPKIYYTPALPGKQVTIKNDGTFVRLHSGTNVQTVQELCMSGKRRYSKEKKTPKAAVSDVTAEKYVVSNNRVHHNNVYVDSRKK